MVARGLALDKNGNIFATENFISGHTDFDPGPGVQMYTSAPGPYYLLKLNSLGDFQWVDIWGGEDAEWIPFSENWAVACDPQGYAYVAGSFWTNDNPDLPADFDPGPGEDNHYVTPGGNNGPDAFLCRFQPDGTW